MRRVLAVLLVFGVLWTPLGAQARRPFRTVSLTAVTTGTGVPADCVGRDAVVVFVRGTGTLTGGVVTIEEADYDPNTEAIYGGTWSSLTTVTATSLSGGVQVAYRPSVGAYRYIRARVTTNVTGGGTVTVVIAGH